MREIKFRAWEETNSTMILEYVDGVDMYGELRVASFHSSAYEKTVPKLKLMQYTGLKDRNGQEIYEGDILDYKWKSSTRDLLIVEWSERDACFLIGGVRTDYAIAYGEVIGNIYENPELVE